tara:strand:+ start:223 stop:408 length:186 start_codon:yes stop_codon:yes gene_type:complete
MTIQEATKQLEREAKDFFNHNPDEEKFGLIMLNSEQVDQIERDDFVFISADEIICKVDNDR